jgi:hypothetical protein
MDEKAVRDMYRINLEKVQGGVADLFLFRSSGAGVAFPSLPIKETFSSFAFARFLAAVLEESNDVVISIIFGEAAFLYFLILAVVVVVAYYIKERDDYWLSRKERDGDALR